MEKKEKTKSKNKSKSKSKSIDKSKSKESKKSSKKIKAPKTQENNKNVLENLPINDTSSIELNNLINPPTAQYNNNIPNINTLNPEAFKYYSALNPKREEQDMNEALIPKCDGCFENDAVVFCEDCDKNYCQKCDEQLHIVPSYRNHVRKSLLNQEGQNNSNDNMGNNNILFSPTSKTCFLHNNEPIQYFCESCEEPICQKCQMIGPHNNKLHKIISISESFKTKFIYINKIANKQLIDKYKEILKQIKALENIESEIKKNKNIIEREIRTEYSKHFENLNSVCGKKFAVINFESNNLQKDLNDLSELVNYINDLINNESPDMINFLLKFKQLNNMIENILSKPININFEMSMDDFPKDVEQKQQMLKLYDQLENLSKYKDEIIWRLLTDKLSKKNPEQNFNNNNIFDENDNRINEETKIEIQKWAKLSDKYASELEKYYLICQFCGCILDETTVNTLCEKNINSNLAENNGINDEKLLVSFKPKENIYGTKRHYFIKPKDNEAKFKVKTHFDRNTSMEGFSSDNK
jgi:palmitoyltransferase